MSDRELVALMASILAAGVRSDGSDWNADECVEAAMNILKAVELGPHKDKL